jgi:hypothetical protein
MQNVPGSDFTVSEHDVALTLKQSYEVERKNHSVNQRIGDHRPFSFKVSSVEETWAKANNDNVEAFKSDSDKEFWLGLARKVLAKRLDPRMFIRRQFMLLERSSPPPPRKMLGSDRAFANYDACRTLSRENIAVAFQSQKDTARNEIILAQDEDCDVIEASVETIWDFELSLSALFRYCLALQLFEQYKDQQFKDAADELHVVAALQYIEDPNAYDTVWGSKWLPVGFRSDAALVYKRVYGV